MSCIEQLFESILNKILLKNEVCNANDPNQADFKVTPKQQII